MIRVTHACLFLEIESRDRVLTVIHSYAKAVLSQLHSIVIRESVNPEDFFPSLGQSKRTSVRCIETVACAVGTRLVEKVYPVYPNVVS